MAAFVMLVVALALGAVLMTGGFILPTVLVIAAIAVGIVVARRARQRRAVR